MISIGIGVALTILAACPLGMREVGQAQGRALLLVPATGARVDRVAGGFVAVGADSTLCWCFTGAEK